MPESALGERTPVLAWLRRAFWYLSHARTRMEDEWRRLGGRRSMSINHASSHLVAGVLAVALLVGHLTPATPRGLDSDDRLWLSRPDRIGGRPTGEGAAFEATEVAGMGRELDRVVTLDDHQRQEWRRDHDGSPKTPMSG